MTLRTGKSSGAFTLIELVLLMAVLTVAAAIIVPALSRFLTGRTEEYEAQRLLSLTHFAQSRAISEGLPVMLWVNARNGTYGLQIETGYTDSDAKSLDFAADKDVSLGTVMSAVNNNSRQPRARSVSKLPVIHFMPDGTIGDGSIAAIYVQDRERRTLWVAQTANGLSYEIEDQATYRQMHR